MYSKRFLRVFLVSITIAVSGSARTWAEVPPVVAVFDLEDKTGKTSAEDLRQLTAYLASKIAEGGLFRVIPSSRLKARLVKQKKESYKSCYDQQCQIEIGRELAANKSLSTQMAKLGDQCVVISTLYDLRHAATEGSASLESPCNVNDLVKAMVKVADRLKGQFKAKRKTSKARRARTTGTLALRSDPPGAVVYLNGKQVARTPRELAVAPGKHTIKMTISNRLDRQQEVRVTGGQVTVVSMKLLPRPEIQRRPSPPVSDTVRPLGEHREERDPEGRRPDASLTRIRRSKTIWGYASLGAGLACAVTAGIVIGVGRAQGSDAYDRYMAVTNPADLDSSWSDVESANTKIIAGYVLIGVASAALGFSLYEFLTRPVSDVRANPGPRVGVVASSDGAWLSLGGEF